MSRSRAIGATVAALALAGAFPASSHAVLTAPQTLLLDTYDARSFRGFAGPVTTSEPLAPGGFYVVRAQGTFSRHLKGIMSPPLAGKTGEKYTLCGTPTAAPLVPSPGRPDSPAGQDPEYVFAYPIEDANKGKGFAKTCATTPPKLASFEIDTGGGFSRRESFDRGTIPRADHTYSYRIEGANLPASFRYTDTNLSDNTGVMTITIEPATAATCGDDARCLASIASGATPAAGAAATQASVIVPTKGCASRRRFRITLRDRKADPIVAATVRVNGKTVKVLRARVRGRTRRVSTVDLRGLPGNRVTVSITAKTKSGQVLRGSRKYFTCKPKRQSGPPRL